MDIEDQGIDKTRYQFIPRVLIFVFDTMGRVLLLKGAKQKRLWSNQWNGIGGHVEAGESIKTAALRELNEEAGITLLNLNLSGLVAIDTAENPGIMMFVFTSKGFKGEVVNSIEGELAWFAPEELRDMLCVEDIPFLVKKCVDYNVGDEPFNAFYTFNVNDRLFITCD